ncbi:cysteine synthase A [Pseudonocardia sediminis]|uniref:Cysteine synthase A n=1 Tax=Pseudonocardia sediminis TaxID=1397368 RepID=A0A4Q7V585_PSEST|nr:pyridoxal-phosphate dependent enzyme [Pseudonocardia sediminis]RZT88654.1 cysteine synthase A [Pseudonocardia sediminis]
MLISRAEDFHTDDLYVDLEPLLGAPLALKHEGFNFAGSIKLKPAQEMVDSAEERGLLSPGSTIVESSSGNLGVALAVVAAGRGYRFVCVTDVRCNEVMRRQMSALGAEVHVVRDPDPVTGLVGARTRRVRELCRSEGYLWLNQYDNPANRAAHERTTGPEIAKYWPDLEVLVVGVGTSGTAMGCAAYFRETRPETRIVAVDAVGSSLFGGPASPRFIPGLGNAIRPAILDESLVDDVVLVPEAETVRMCRRLAGAGFLLGGSSGTVVSGALRWAREHGWPDRTAVAVAPDTGVPYLDTVYDDDWVGEVYGRAGGEVTP